MMHESIRSNKQGLLLECADAAPVVANLPYYYAIHLNVPCNQKCVMCAPYGNHTDKRMITLDDFAAFFAQIENVAEHLTLIGGETFMYPWIGEVLDLLAQHEIAVTINTNATMLTPDVTPRLLALHELNLRCSVDAATRETYHRIRGTDVFDKVIANMRRFSTTIEGNERTRMILVYVVMRENLSDVLPFVELARTFNIDRVEFLPVRHVTEWQVTNGTGWRFDGREQSCESFRGEYNDVMREAGRRCEAAGVRYETHLIP